MSSLTPVAFDIETTGFETTAETTVVGLVFPMGVRVLFNTGGRTVETDQLSHQLESLFGDPVVLTAHASERELLDAFSSTVTEKVAPRDYFLTAYNGERWKSGFDLPFLRTRFLTQAVDWPFVDVPYADLLPIFDARFNTTTETDDEQTATLEHVYDELIGGELGDHDPFDDSAEAVTAFERGEFEPLLQHNIADTLRTDALARVAEQYCSKSDFKLKSLSPTRTN